MHPISSTQQNEIEGWVLLLFCCHHPLHLASYRQPKKFMAGAFACIFWRLNTTPYLWATCMRFCRWASCSTSVQPCTVMSLVILIHPCHSSQNWSIFFWKMSSEQTRPKGRCRKWYLPKGLLKVVKRLDSSSRTIDQYL